MKNDGKFYLGVSDYGLTLGAVLERVLKDHVAQPPPRLGCLTAHLTNSASCANFVVCIYLFTSLFPTLAIPCLFTVEVEMFYTSFVGYQPTRSLDLG